MLSLRKPMRERLALRGYNKTEEALGSDPQYAPAHNAMELIYYAREQDDKAIEYYEKALKIAPDDVLANNGIGVSY